MANKYVDTLLIKLFDAAGVPIFEIINYESIYNQYYIVKDVFVTAHLVKLELEFNVVYDRSGLLKIDGFSIVDPKFEQKCIKFIKCAQKLANDKDVLANSTNPHDDEADTEIDKIFSECI